MLDKCWSNLDFRESIRRLDPRVITTNLYFIDSKLRNLPLLQLIKVMSLTTCMTDLVVEFAN